MKKSESGIAHITLLLIVILVAAIGFTGWRVYENSKDSDDAAQNTTTTTNAKETDDAKSTPEAPSFTFTEPQGWTIKKTVNGQETNVAITSPDFKEAEGELCNTIASGYRFTISYAPGEPEVVATILAEKSELFKNQKQTTVSSEPAVEYDSSPGECGFSHSVATHKDGYTFYISGYLGDEDFQNYNDEFQALVKSVKFE